MMICGAKAVWQYQHSSPMTDVCIRAPNHEGRHKSAQGLRWVQEPEGRVYWERLKAYKAHRALGHVR